MAKDILKDPEPVKGAGKSVVDAVLSAVRVGNALMYLLSGLLAAVLMIYSGYILYDTIATDYKAYTSSWELMRYKPDAAEEDPTEGQELLSDINEDYRAWLTVYDTTIDYPVVQGRDNLYYASHDIYRNASLTGAIYLAAENKADFTDSYNLVYGHHMDNGAMFGSLDSFADQDYFNAHKYGVIVTPSGVYDIELFAVVSTDAYENQIYTVGNRAKEVLTFLTGDRTNDVGVGTKIRVFDEKAAKNAAKIIALSTCSDAETNGRLVVFGKMTYRGTEGKCVGNVALAVTADHGNALNGNAGVRYLHSVAVEQSLQQIGEILHSKLLVERADPSEATLTEWNDVTKSENLGKLVVDAALDLIRSCMQ